MAYFIIKTGDLRVDGIAFMGGKKLNEFTLENLCGFHSI